jgi:hypothetical protein
LGGHESAVTSVSGKFFFVTFNPVYVRDKRVAFTRMNWLCGDAKAMTFVPIISCVHPSRHTPTIMHAESLGHR